MDRPDVGEQVQTLAQRNVDAGVSTTDRRGHRTFQTNIGSIETVNYILRQGLAGFLNHIRVQFGDFPIDADAGGVDGAPRGAGDLRADSIARDQGNWIGHPYIVKARAAAAPFSNSIASRAPRRPAMRR